MDKKLRRETGRATRRYAAALRSVAKAYETMWESENLGAFRPDSPAASEDERLSSQFGADYVDHGGSIEALASAYLTVGVDHLRSTAELLPPRDLGVFSVWVTGRAMLEVSSIAYWLLEPEISAGDRIERVLNDRLNSLAGAAHFIEKGGIDDSQILADPMEAMNGVIEQAERMGLEVNSEGKVSYIGEARRPSMTTLVDDLTESGYYSLFSGYSHGEIWTIGHHQEAADVEDPTGQNRSFSSGRITLNHYQQLCQALVKAFDRVVYRLASHFGWSPTNWDLAVEQASKNLSYLI